MRNIETSLRWSQTLTRGAAHRRISKHNNKQRLFQSKQAHADEWEPVAVEALVTGIGAIPGGMATEIGKDKIKWKTTEKQQQAC